MTILEHYDFQMESRFTNELARTSNPDYSTALPSYISMSPVGFHAIDLLAYLKNHPTYVSPQPNKMSWATEEAAQKLSMLFRQTPGDIALCNIFIYNKTRHMERICPSCRRIYRVGEGPTQWFSFDDFLAREYLPYLRFPYTFEDLDEETSTDVATTEEQMVSGLCSSVCYKMFTSEFQDMLGDEIAAWVNAYARDLIPLQQLASLGGWVMRKATAEEEMATGMKIIWDDTEEEEDITEQRGL